MNKLGLIICTWSDVANISRKLAVDISKKGRPDLVVGIPRGGCCVATIIAEMLRRNMITLCATRRKNDIEVSDNPDLINSLDNKIIKNKKILIIDEIVVTGKTIETIKSELLRLGALSVETCVFANRSNGDYTCDYQHIITNKNNIIFPWDYLVLDDQDKIIVHPEYQEMCKSLGVDLDGM